MLQRILVATDLSSRSELAIARALLLAGRPGAAVTLLHVVDEDRPEAMLEAEITAARAHLEQAWSGRAASAGTALAIEVVPGVAHEAIGHRAQASGADLVVVGAHRRRWLRDVFVGTTAERVIRAGVRPVLMVSGPAERAWRRAIAAVDLSGPSRHALVSAARLGLLEGLRLTVLHGFLPLAEGKMQFAGIAPDRIEAYKAEVRARLARELDAFLATPELEGLAAERRVEEGTAFEVIEGRVDAGEADLVILGTRGLGGLERALLGSVTEEVLRAIPADVLAVPPAEAA